MAKVERICPECGTINSTRQTTCTKCRASLTGATSQRPPPMNPFSRRGMAILAWRATLFLGRHGYRLARSQAQARVDRARTKTTDVKNETIEGDFTVSEWNSMGPPSDPNAQGEAKPLHWGPKP